MGYEMGLLLTASLAFLSLSSAFALFNVFTSTPNIDLPRLRSPFSPLPPVSTLKFNLGRLPAWVGAGFAEGVSCMVESPSPAGAASC